MKQQSKTAQPVQFFRQPPPVRVPATGGADWVVVLRALAEDTRLRIVELLMEASLDVNAISKQLDISQYNVSKHLRILREAGLLEVEKTGRRHLYRLPAIMRRRGADGDVLDLGCCSFRFSEGVAEMQPPEGSSDRNDPIDPPRVRHGKSARR